MPSILRVNISLLFFGAGPCCARSSALGARNQHKLVGSSGCGIVCDNIQDGLVDIRLLRVSAGPRVKVRAKGPIARDVLGACIYYHCEESPGSPCFIVTPPDYFTKHISI